VYRVAVHRHAGTYVVRPNHINSLLVWARVPSPILSWGNCIGRVAAPHHLLRGSTVEDVGCWIDLAFRGDVRAFWVSVLSWEAVAACISDSDGLQH
jgi:hypothetical protein